MTNITQRGEIYWFDKTIGGRRVRVSLGTENSKAAERLANRIQFAIGDGPKSEVWTQLKAALPKSSYESLTQDYQIEEPVFLPEVEHRFEKHLTQRKALGNLSESSCKTYFAASRNFFDRMAELKIQRLDEATPSVVDEYLCWRKSEVMANGGNGRGVLIDRSMLSLLFTYAREEGLITLSPLRGKFKAPGVSKGAEPFSPEEMKKLAEVIPAEDQLAFLLLRHTGMRCSDVTTVTWESINWTTKTLTWLTRKRKKLVLVPLVSELYDYLWHLKTTYANDCDNQNPLLVGIGRNQLYDKVQKWGKLAGVENATPHRFRDSLAVTILANGGTIYDCARILGITVGTCDTYYSSFTQQLQDRVRGIMEHKETT